MSQNPSDGLGPRSGWYPRGPMPDAPVIYLCRHGDTAWSPMRRLAGRTDLDLTEPGQDKARQLGRRLAGLAFDRVWMSPLLRTRRTAELAGFAARAVGDDRLIEMSFGAYEGQTVQEVRVTRPGWTYLQDGCPGGETAEDLGRRADAVLAELRALGGTTLIFGHSVVSRVMTARFLELPPRAGRHFMLAPGAISVLGYDPVDDAPAIAAWNDRGQPEAPPPRV
jgi:broad specificity phosphatase PhoE